MKLLLAVIGTLALSAPSRAQSVTGHWTYLDDGSDQGTAWIAPQFTPVGWKSGPQQLGYGDGDEATVVGYGPAASNKYVTTYFRGQFYLDPVVNYTHARLRLVRDDGAVVYVNGQEVLRSNLPSGPIDYLTLASANVAGNFEQDVLEFALDMTLFVPGDNHVAVEVHQWDPASSDLSFDLELVLVEDPICRQGTQFTVGDGTSCALSGDTALIGVGAAGQVFVHERDQGGTGAWESTTSVIGGDTVSGDDFGASLALSGSTGAAGAPGRGADTGAVYLFERDAGAPGAWGEVTTLVASSGAAGDRFGEHVALDQDTLDAAAPGHAGGQGAVYVFERDAGGPGTWGEVARLQASVPAASDGFAGAVDVDANTIVIGARHAGSNQGEVHVFVRPDAGSTSWALQTVFSSVTVLPEEFGAAVALSGDVLAVGSPETSGGSGRVYAFQRDLGGPGVWGLLGKSDGWPGLHQHLGSEVAVADGLVAGAAFGPGTVKGYVDVLAPTPGAPTVWSHQHRVAIPSGVPGQGLGSSVAADGTTLLAGAPLAVFPQLAYFFELLPAVESYCTAGLSSSGCSATLSHAGLASASAGGGFELFASGAQGNKDGLFFFGTSGRQAAPWGNGTSYQCVAPPVNRTGIASGQGLSGTCEGSAAVDLAARWSSHPNQNPGAGATVQAQFWYRDPASTSNQSTSLSNALEFVTCP